MRNARTGHWPDFLLNLRVIIPVLGAAAATLWACLRGVAGVWIDMSPTPLVALPPQDIFAQIPEALEVWLQTNERQWAPTWPLMDISRRKQFCASEIAVHGTQCCNWCRLKTQSHWIILLSSYAWLSPNMIALKYIIHDVTTQQTNTDQFQAC